ncbi:ash family protein [Pseudomonas chlororaphis]|nr:ash family protein [Pseudomonas chlororaphis]QTT97735.1 ash family protein [Pseudomonas chlororaphis]
MVIKCGNPVVAAAQPPRYPSAVAAKSATGPGNPKSKKAQQQRPDHQVQALFLCLYFCVMAAVRGRPSGLPGSFCLGFPARVQLPPFSPGNENGSFFNVKGVTPMYASHLYQPHHQQAAGGAQ